MMSLDFILLTLLILIGFAGLFFMIRRQQPSQELLEVVKLLQHGSKEDRKILLDSLQKNTADVNQRLDRAAQVIGMVQRNLGEMNEIGRGIKDLQEFLRSPKVRGNLGEHILKELLTQILPQQSFSLQHTFKSGVTVDAVLITTNGLVPIDAKFPLEAFRLLLASEQEAEKASAKRQFTQDVKKHIRDISNKYLVTTEGTIDYALMYIPSEAVYYEAVNDADLFDYAARYRVLPVSPTTLYAYLRAILMSFEGQKIEKQAREIIKTLRALQKDYEKLGEALSVLGRHLTNAYNANSAVFSHFTVLGNKLRTTQQLEEQNDQQLKIETS
ncbi:DNA recombination protein RmuC [Candidatus Roizmanbacteria bacterium]|nr:DNA recombination protein RmuC [Candidatus Roizmanbacteria bacterium]